MNASIAVRNLTAAEVHDVINWAREEGWNPSPHDAASFYAADPEGFFVALHEDQPAAVISVVRYGTAYAFLGLYICRPELRGRGFGTRVWNAGLRHAGDRVVGLDGVPQQQENYARAGFLLAWRNRRYQGLGGGGPVHGVVDLDTIPFAKIAAFDGATFEANRTRFLRSWIAQPDAVRLGLVRDGQMAGWGLLRRCAEGHKIGPLVAIDQHAAERLLDGLLAAAPGEPVFLDVPEPNTTAIRAAEARGMAPVFETARMYRGEAPQIALDRIWGITSFELG